MKLHTNICSTEYSYNRTKCKYMSYCVLSFDKQNVLNTVNTLAGIRFCVTTANTSLREHVPHVTA